MIYLTGDTHAGTDMRKLSRKQLKRQGISITENDILIITGDFGFPFLPEDIGDYENNDGEYAFWMKWFAERPYKILFVDGNHDNHDWWAQQDVSEMFGGKVQVHPHAENVIHLMRGEVYTIEGLTFFTFGGAASTDKTYRKEGISWWSGEEANDDEIRNALDNLEKADNKVDCIITHTIPKKLISEIPMFCHKDIPCRTASFLETVLDKVRYDKWFCGHFHTDSALPEHNIFALYNTVHSLGFFDRVRDEDISLYTRECF